MERADHQNLVDQMSYKVIKANNLIQKTRFNLSTVEQKTILYIISKIKPETKEFEEYNFSIIEYCKICGIDYKNGGNYKYIKQKLKSLRDKSIWIELEDKTETTLSWIEKVFINKQNGTIRIKIDNMMKPYLLQLQNHFTQYELFYVLSMKSQYSIKIYELLKSYQYLNRKQFDIEELKKTLCAENYKRFPDFKSRVLDIAMKEINMFSDINILYEIKKEGKKYAKLEFIIKPKNAIDRFKNISLFEK